MAFRPAGRNLSDFFGDKPDYSALGSQATMDDAKSDINAALNNARSAATVMKAEADEASAAHWADATRETGAIAGQTQAVTDIAGAVGGLGGLFDSGGGKDYGSLGRHDFDSNAWQSAKAASDSFDWS